MLEKHSMSTVQYHSLLNDTGHLRCENRSWKSAGMSHNQYIKNSNRLTTAENLIV